VALQGLHFVEHIAQVTQKFFLDLPQAHGLLGAALDTEWVHFAYNLALFSVLGGLVLAYRLHHKQSWIERPGWYHLMLLSVATLQLYHMVEHSVKVAQHVTAACASCPGLLGATVNLVWLHFFINLLVLVPMTVAVAGFVLAGTSAARTGQQDSIPSLGGK
jgi:uncharacterized membrane protein YhdT